MDSEPNYKVLSTVTINGNKVELREYADHWGVASFNKKGQMRELIKTNYKTATLIYHYSQIC